MRKIFIQFFFCTLPAMCLAQQEALFSQYMFNGLIVNPAYAGYKENLNISLLSRSQWVGIKGAPYTQSVIADGAFFYNKNVGLGLAVVNDRMGIQEQTSAMFNYAYRLPVGKDARLSFGIALGAVQFSLNSDKAIVNDHTDPAFMGNQNYISPDARIGAYYSDENFYAGVSATNLLTNALNKNKERAKYIILPATHLFLTAGTILDIDEDNIKFKPSLMLRDDPNGTGNIDINSSFLFKEKVWIGVSYRLGVDMWKKNATVNKTFQQNSLVGLVEVFIAKQFRIGYAYDYSLSDLNTYSNGSHEFSIGFIIGNKERNNALTTPRYF